MEDEMANAISEMAAVVLAAGFGRLTESKSKLVERLDGKPILVGVVEKAKKAGFGKVVVVVSALNHEFRRQIQEELLNHDLEVEYAYQNGRFGPADAVLQATHVLRAAGIQNFVVLFGDMPMLSLDEMESLVETHLRLDAKMTISSWRYDPQHWLASAMYNYAYVNRLPDCGHYLSTPTVHMYEGKPPEGAEVLSSMYAFDREWFIQACNQIKPRSKGDGYSAEIHLPQLIEIAVVNAERLVNVAVRDPVTILGVNTSADFCILTSLTAGTGA